MTYFNEAFSEEGLQKVLHKIALQGTRALREEAVATEQWNGGRMSTATRLRIAKIDAAYELMAHMIEFHLPDITEETSCGAVQIYLKIEKEAEE